MRQIILVVTDRDFKRLVQKKGSLTWYQLLVPAVLGYNAERRVTKLGHVRPAHSEIHPKEPSRVEMVAPC